MLQIGCHLSSSKGFLHMGEEAVSIGATTFQFFTRNPRGSKAKAVDEKDVAAYLAFAKEILVHENKDGIGEDAVSVVVSDAVVYMPLEDLVDREKEIERLKKEQERLAKEIARCQGMLSNPNFVNKAPEAKVNAEKEKLQKYEEMMEKVKIQLTQMDK